MSADSLEIALQKHFGHTAFRKPQREVIASILAGRDTLAIMPTGGGKSLCYQLPALLLEGVTLIVSPLIALMKDQVDALRARGIPAAMINSAQSWDDQKIALDQMANGELKLVYIAPERFRANSFLRALAGVKIALFAIDEAHCISQWGHDFRPDYLRLSEALERLGHPVCAAFTATATPEVKADIQKQLRLREGAVFVSGFARPNLSFHIRTVERKAQKLDRIHALIERHQTGIVYCATRKSAEAVADDLKAHRIKHILYHGGLSAEGRVRAQEAFMTGKAPVAVATNAFGMGIDRADIRFVCHYELPGSVEAFYQEAGRAGRDGLPAHCEVLFMYADKRVQDFFIDGANPDPDLIRRVYAVLRKNADNGYEVHMSAEDIAEEAFEGRRVTAGNAMAVQGAISQLRHLGFIERFDEGGSRVRGTRLLQPDVTARDIVLPLDRLAEKRERDEAKLKAFIRFAYDAGCRQTWILRYFGEADIAPCGACDHCRDGGAHGPAPLNESQQMEVRKALSGIARMSNRSGPRQWQPRFGRDKIVKCLLGSRDEKLLASGLDRLSTYGIFKHHKKPFVAALLSAIEAAGLVAVEQDGEYPLLGLTEAGVCAMLDGGEIRLRWPGGEATDDEPAPAVAPARERAAKLPIPTSEESAPEMDDELFNALAAERNRLRFAHGNLPAYTIFPNKVLEALAAQKPATAEAAMEIKGIGPEKAKRWLPAFLKIIAAHEGSM